MDGLLELLKSFPDLVKEVYGDLAKPGVQQAGKAVGTLVGLGNTALIPIAMANEKCKLAFEQNMELYRKKLESKSVEQICEVPPELGVPVLEKLAYVSDKELSELYTELLAKASDPKTAHYAHPSFVNILNNLSPDEALLLQSIKGLKSIPIIEVKLVVEGQQGWQVLHPMIAGIKDLDKLSHLNNLPAYIKNLESQGVLSTRRGVYMVGDGIYEPLEENARELYKDICNQGMSLNFGREKIEVTQLGELFLSACLKEN